MLLQMHSLFVPTLVFALQSSQSIIPSVIHIRWTFIPQSGWVGGWVGERESKNCKPVYNLMFFMRERERERERERVRGTNSPLHLTPCMMSPHKNLPHTSHQCGVLKVWLLKLCPHTQGSPPAISKDTKYKQRLGICMHSVSSLHPFRRKASSVYKLYYCVNACGQML